MRIVPLITLLVFLLPVCAKAQESWCRSSLKGFVSYVDNAGTLDAHDNYRQLDLGSDTARGFAISMIDMKALDHEFELEFSLSQMSSSGIQSGAPGAASDKNFLHVDTKRTEFALSARSPSSCQDKLLAPWLGGGLNVTLMELTEQENIAKGQTIIPMEEHKTSSEAVGAHVSAGINIYPVKESALAAYIETRYTTWMINPPVNGNLSGFSIRCGIRWDFGTRL